MEAKLDIGENLTNLLERLAQQVGTTVDKIFPWYVQQAYYEGIVYACVFAALIVTALVVIIIGSIIHQHDKEDPGLALLIVGSIVLSAILFVGSIAAGDIITKIVNPQYHAMNALTDDLRKLR